MCKHSTEAAKEEMKTEKAQPSLERLKSNCKGRKHSELWRNEVCKMRSSV
jgi:hypothetical protein